jgi:hypothetical protein
VEKFHRQAIFIDKNTEGTLAQISWCHSCKRIWLFIKNLGGRRNLLKIIPEKSLLNSNRYRRKTSDRNVKGCFKRFSVKFNTIEWENGADFAPEYLYERGTVV